jgi:hypothetical protein
MAIATLKNGFIREVNQINLNDCIITADNNDIQIIYPDGKRISVSNLLERLETLETLFMERTLLGSDPGKIE